MSELCWRTRVDAWLRDSCIALMQVPLKTNLLQAAGFLHKLFNMHKCCFAKHSASCGALCARPSYTLHPATLSFLSCFHSPSTARSGYCRYLLLRTGKPLGIAPLHARKCWAPPAPHTHCCSYCWRNAWYIQSAVACIEPVNTAGALQGKEPADNNCHPAEGTYIPQPPPPHSSTWASLDIGQLG